MHVFTSRSVCAHAIARHKCKNLMHAHEYKMNFLQAHLLMTPIPSPSYVIYFGAESLCRTSGTTFSIYYVRYLSDDCSQH